MFSGGSVDTPQAQALLMHGQAFAQQLYRLAPGALRTAALLRLRESMAFADDAMLLQATKETHAAAG